MLALKSRIWEKLQNKNKTKTNVFNQHTARKKKKKNKKEREVFWIKETWETYQLNVMHRPYLNLVLNSPIT